MATKSKELADGCLSKVAEDEPVFVLRARDKFAPGTVRDWANRAYGKGVPDEKVKEALELALVMEKWQQEGARLQGAGLMSTDARKRTLSMIVSQREHARKRVLSHIETFEHRLRWAREALESRKHVDVGFLQSSSFFAESAGNYNSFIEALEILGAEEIA